MKLTFRACSLSSFEYTFCAAAITSGSPLTGGPSEALHCSIWSESHATLHLTHLVNWALAFRIFFGVNGLQIQFRNIGQCDLFTLRICLDMSRRTVERFASHLTNVVCLSCFSLHFWFVVYLVTNGFTSPACCPLEYGYYNCSTISFFIKR